MADKKNELFNKFTKELFSMEVIDFIGTAKLFGVSLAKENENEMRPMEDIVADILNGFNELSNSKKKEVLKLCKQANRSGKNGHRTKKSDSEEHIPTEDM